MSVLQKFVAYAEALPDEQRLEIDELLESIMIAELPEFELTQEELAETLRRLADPNPEYADPAEIEAIFRRYDKL